MSHCTIQTDASQIRVPHTHHVHHIHLPCTDTCTRTPHTHTTYAHTMHTHSCTLTHAHIRMHTHSCTHTHALHTTLPFTSLLYRDMRTDWHAHSLSLFSSSSPSPLSIIDYIVMYISQVRSTHETAAICPEFVSGTIKSSILHTD